MQPGNVIRLECGFTDNDWGKPQETSLVYQIAASNGSQDSLSPLCKQTFAELWMGTYPLVPSYVHGTMKPLSVALLEMGTWQGSGEQSPFSSDGQLPFLFKVLSIGKALCIQVHPEEAVAIALHRENPNRYPDGNPKPEMVVALTEFRALCGFRPPSVWLRLLKKLEALRTLIPRDAIRDLEDQILQDTDGAKELMRPDSICAICTSILAASAPDTKDALKAVVALAQFALSTGDYSTLDMNVALLLLELQEQYPYDVGLIIAMFMNYVVLRPGEAMFVPTGQVHAYISGDALECMTPSANIARIGLTWKFKDIPGALRMIDFVPQSPQLITPRPYERVSMLQSAQSSSSCLLYRPVSSMFAVLMITLLDVAEIALDPTRSGVIFLCLQGSGTIKSLTATETLEHGSVLFAVPEAGLRIRHQPGDLLVLYAAFFPDEEWHAVANVAPRHGEEIVAT